MVASICIIVKSRYSEKKLLRTKKFSKYSGISLRYNNSRRSPEKIGPVCELVFSDCSYAYRKGRGTADELRRFCEYLSKYPFAAKIDQKSCFDSIDFEILEKSLYSVFFERKIVNLLMSFARMSVVEEGRLTERKKGSSRARP